VPTIPLVTVAIGSGQLGYTGIGLQADPRVLDHLWQLGKAAADGGDIRELLFGPTDHRVI
jgi:hypothetical protein